MASLAEIYYNSDNDRFKLKRNPGFTPEQGKVMRRYLEHMRDVPGDEFLHNEPQTAIDRRHFLRDARCPRPERLPVWSGSGRNPRHLARLFRSADLARSTGTCSILPF
jgi:hypothetical protein